MSLCNGDSHERNFEERAVFAGCGVMAKRELRVNLSDCVLERMINEC